MQDFMNGRYGADELSFSLGVLGIVLALLATIFSVRVLSLIALAVLIIALARSFSKNIPARRKENDAFRTQAAKIPVVGERIANMGSSARSAYGSAATAARGATKEDLKRQARTAKKMWKERKTKAFLKCPTCGTMLSVPKGKGRLIVTCPKCKTRMETKS